jgi:hypothetical protein
VRVLWVSLALLAGVVAACVSDDATGSSGNVGSSGNIGSNGDTGSSGSSGSSGSADPGCDSSADFGAPIPVDKLNGGLNQDGARITPSGNELYLTRWDDADKPTAIHRYTRSAWDQEWAYDRLESNLVIGTVRKTNTGSSLAFESDTKAYFSKYENPDGGTESFARLQVTERSGSGVPWGVPIELSLPAPRAASEEYPWYDPPTGSLYFAAGTKSTTFTGLVDFGLVVATRTASANFLAVTPLTISGLGMQVNNSEFAPVLLNRQDGVTLYFATTPGRDIRRSVGGGASFTGTALSSLNSTTKDDQVTWISPNGCEVYLTVDHKIYRARRPATM